MMTKKEWKQLGKGMGFLSPWLIGFIVFTALPVALSLYYAFTDYALLNKPLWVGIDNFRELLWEKHPGDTYGDPHFWKSLGNTFYYVVLALPAGMAVSLGLAFLLNVKTGAQAVYRTIIFLPTLVPAVASAMLWMWLFNTKLGLINGLLWKLGVHSQPGWLTDPSLALPSLALMTLWGMGNTVVIYVAGLQDVPKELYEAAEIDGAGVWRRLWHVTIPMVSPVIFFNLIMAIIGSLQVFALPQIMTNGGPNEATRFYAMCIYDNAFNYLRMGYASAMAWILFAIILVLTGVAFWSSRKWVHYQGK